jgi:hypothetical protein
MENYLKIANYFLGEEYTLAPTGNGVAVPNTDMLRNDYTSIFPHGMGDSTLMTQKEIESTIDTLANTNDLRHLLGYKNQAEDNLETLRRNGQKNRIDDLNVRLFMVEKAIAIKNSRAPHLEN